MIPPHYPRPQLVRDRWASLDGDWQFIEGDSEGAQGERSSSLHPAWTESERIIVPFPPESPLSMINRDVADVLWYRRSFELAVSPLKRAILHFEAVDYSADVWVNGHHVGSHEGGQTRFSFDITPHLADGATQVLEVRTVDRAKDLEQPRGKQDWSDDPHVIWYRRTSGIWRTVWWEEVPETHISRLTLTPAADLSLQVEVEVEGSWSGSHLELAVMHDGADLSRSRHAVLAGSWSGRIHLNLGSVEIEPDALLWSPEHPTLLDIELFLVAPDGAADRVLSYTGMRTIDVDDRHVLLNNHPYFLRLVLEQGYWPQSHLAAPSSEALQEEAALIKNLGFNGLRVHQKVADPRFLRCCDELGLIVWADSAAAYSFSEKALRRSTQEWMQIVERDRNHPCIAAWVPFNESWGLSQLETDPRQRSAVRALHSLIRALDPTRLVLGNDGWEYTDGDVIGVHDYTHDPEVLRARFGSEVAVRATVENGRSGGRRISLGGRDTPHRPVVLSEFGGVNLSPSPDAWAGYGGAEDGLDYLNKLRTLVEEVRGAALAGYCYTQLTDTAQEQNGLLDERRVPKVPLHELAAIFGS